MRKLKNTYFILRHGQTIHQTKKKDIVYGWPDDNPPCGLTNKGKKDIQRAAQKLKQKGIDLIFASDTRRTRETAEIVAKKLGLKVNYDKRLRDVNWGIYQGKSKLKAWAYYKNPKLKFKKAPPGGESWADVEKRIVGFLKELEKKYKQKTILIVSHGDPLWLLEGWLRGLNQKQLLIQKLTGQTIKTGEIRQLNKL
ncbi:histidine phosphatase family protein [bacterium]|nr:histidine phosphatase family protein [bacterium]